MYNYRCIHIVMLLLILCLQATAYADDNKLNDINLNPFQNIHHPPQNQEQVTEAPAPILSDSTQSISAGMTFYPQEPVLPEITTAIRLSSSDVNRIICPTEIKDAPRSSGEKGVIIEFSGRNVWVKFKASKQGNKVEYLTTPTEIFVHCGGAIYSLIALPSRIPAQTIRLGSGKATRMKENNIIFAGMPFEKKIFRLVREAYTDSIPDSYLVTRSETMDTSYKSIIINSYRDIAIEGEGLKLKELHVSLKPGETAPFKLSEKQFLNKFTESPVAIAIDKHNLNQPGDLSRVFIIEQSVTDTDLFSIGIMEHTR